MRTTFKDNPQQASIAGLKGAETRRKMKAYKEQHRAAMISKAEEIVSDFMDNKPVFGIDLKPELREKIIESVLTEVTVQSLVGALKHRDEVDLILLRHELTKSGNPITGVDGVESGEQSDAPAMLTNAELMHLVGTQSEAKSRQSYDPLGGMPDLPDLPDLGDGDDDLPEHFFTWYQSQPEAKQESILKTYFRDDLEQLLNHAGRPTRKVCDELNIRV